MFAIVEISGFQWEVQENSIVDIPFKEGNPGDSFEINKILMAGSDDNTKFGSPFIDGSVSAKIIEQLRGDKLLVFKKKRRKGYRKLNGHRQDFTRIEITNINI